MKAEANVQGIFRFTPAELSGALADLGVMLPLVLALITLNGVDATSAFVGIGLAYLVTALVYRLPVPVQPLKSVSAVALALGLSARLIVAAAWWNAVLFLLMAWTRADRLIARLFTRPVVRGIQLGLAVLLGRSAWNLISAPGSAWQENVSIAGAMIPWVWLLGVGTLAVLLLGLRLSRDWAGLATILFGVTLAVLYMGVPSVSLTVSLPRPASIIPRPDELWQALWLLAVPQIPLSLANSVFATADAARQYFGLRRVDRALSAWRAHRRCTRDAGCELPGAGRARRRDVTCTSEPDPISLIRCAAGIRGVSALAAGTRSARMVRVESGAADCADRLLHR